MAVLERVPVDRITDKAREIRFSRSVVVALCGLLYALGWIAAKAFGLLWFSAVWVGAAVVVGWTDARKPKQPRVD